MHDHALSAQQLDVISALSSGATMTAAAVQAGIHRNTIAYWRRNLLTFQHALADAQYDKAMLFREKTEELMDLAIQTLRDILSDAQAPAGVRLKAALAVISTASTPPEPKKQIELEIHPVQLATPAQSPATKKHKDAQTEMHNQMHKDAQTGSSGQSGHVTEVPDFPPFPIDELMHDNARTYRRESPKIGRNEPCPCGSGQKYKRCCLDKPASASKAA